MQHEWKGIEMHVGYWWESQKEDQDADRWTILKRILRETVWGGMECIHLAQDRNQWRALVNMVINLRVL
jgi:hypothetical protein